MSFLSRTKTNLNRPFFICANNLDHDPYPYFQWVDQNPNGYTLALNHPSYWSPAPAPLPAKPSKTAKTPRSQAITTTKRTYQGHLLNIARKTHASVQKRAEGVNEQEKQERQPTTIIITRDRHLHRRLARGQQYSRPWCTVSTPGTPKH